MDKDKLKRRYDVFGIIIFLLFAVLFGRLVQLQIVQGSYYKKQSEERRIRLVSVSAPRGTIYDRYGQVLASNRPSFTVEFIRTEVTDANINDVLVKLVAILDKNGEKYKNDLPIKINPYVFDFKNIGEEEVTQDVLTQREMKWKDANKIPREATAEETFNLLKKRYGISDALPVDLISKLISLRLEIDKQGYQAYQPVIIARDIKQETVAEIEERHIELPGIVIEVESVRYYPLGNVASHILGYIGKIDENDLANLDKTRYKMTDLIGKYGLELILEKYLKGEDGGKQVEVNAVGQMTQVLGEKPSVPGDSVVLTIDRKLQEVTEKALADTMARIRAGQGLEKSPANIGAAVVLDVNTGEVLALASQPSFDPNLFATGNITKEIAKQLYPPSKKGEIVAQPMFNYATRGAVPPGSTFKMVTGIAGLENGVITPDEKILDTGIYPYAHRPACWIWNERRQTHGLVDLKKAIQVSCNVYFFEVGRRLGIEEIDKYAHKLGLGEKTGIELGESKGLVAGPEARVAFADRDLSYLKSIGTINEDQKQEILNLIRTNENRDSVILKKLTELGITKNEDKMRIFYLVKNSYWNLGNTLSASIGQAENQYTPVQMASYIATLVNGGTRYKVHLVKKIIDPNGNVVLENKPEAIDKINLNPKNIQAIKEGLYAVTQPGGTAASAFVNFPIKIGGKTGTAQNPPFSPYAWFVGFAPLDNPQIAVVVVIYQGGHGNAAAEVAKPIFLEYFGLNNTGNNININNQFVR